MAFRARWIGAAAAVVASAACAFPLEVALEAWSWSACWDEPGHEAPDEAFGEVRGEGEVVAEPRPVGGFDAVFASGPLRVVLERDGRDQVTVTAEESLLPYLETEVRGGILYVEPAPGVMLVPGEEIVIHVECEEVSDVSASGAAAVEADLGWLPQVWISLRDDAALTVQGETELLHASLSGASRLDALDLRGGRAVLRTVDDAEAWVSVRDRLEVDAAGDSRVRFRGKPVVDARVAATSSVTRY